MAEPIVNQKVCTVCGTTKRLTEFYKRADSKHGVAPECKSCKAVARRILKQFKPKVSEKRCVLCEAVKDASQFAVCRKSPDGLFYQCKACTRCAEKMRKYCIHCKIVKPINEFVPSRTKNDDHGSLCKPCNDTHARKWVANNRERNRARASSWEKQPGPRARRRAYLNRPEVKARNKASQRRFLQTPRGKRMVLNKHLRLKFGITIDMYESLLLQQGSVCAICKGTCQKNGRLSVDHSHVTGKVRGLICDDCNIALGRFKDSADLCRRAAIYLENHTSLTLKSPAANALVCPEGTVTV